MIEKKIENNKTFYLVKWKGYSDKDNTWEPISSFKSCLSMLSKFSGNVSQDDQTTYQI